MRDLLHHGGHSGEAAHQHLAAHPTHAEDSCKEREVRGQQRSGGDLRAGSLRNINSRLRGCGEVKLVTHLSQLVRNRTETTPSQETTHIRSDIFLYQVNQVYKIIYQTNIIRINKSLLQKYKLKSRDYF